MDKIQLGAFIAENRKALGMTQKELAARLHVTDKAVSKWERGLSYPDVTLLEPLAEVFGLSLTELVSCTPHAEPEEAADEEQNVKSILTISTDSVTAARKKGRCWIAALGAACIALAAVLLLLSWPHSLPGIFSWRGGTRVESASVIASPVSEEPNVVHLSQDEILRLEDCLRSSTARWRGFSNESLYWETGTLYTVFLNFNDGQSRECRILNGMLYAKPYAYRLDAETASRLELLLASFAASSR